MPVFVGLLTIDLYLPEADSLKDKRRVLESLLTRLRNRYQVAVAQVDDTDLHRRAQIALATVSNSQAQVQRVLDATSRFINSQPAVVVEAENCEIL